MNQSLFPLSLSFYCNSFLGSFRTIAGIIHFIVWCFMLIRAWHCFSSCDGNLRFISRSIGLLLQCCFTESCSDCNWDVRWNNWYTQKYGRYYYGTYKERYDYCHTIDSENEKKKIFSNYRCIQPPNEMRVNQN